MIRLYGVPGCGPCEVAKLWLKGQGFDFDFIDLSQDASALARVRGRLGDTRGGVILERDGRLTAMVGVSPARLEHWYRTRLNPEAPAGGGEPGA